MGTSSSSKGSPSGVPMVPPWVPDVPSEPGGDQPPLETTEQTSPANPPEQAAPNEEPAAPSAPLNDRAKLAPPRRFQAATANLTSFARNNDRSAMRRGVGQYIRQGYGGSGTATRRMGGTIRASEGLFSALSGGAGNPFQTTGGPLDPAVLAGQSADEIMDAMTEAVRPVDGTQDAEASRAAIKDALADTLTQYPEANLLQLSEEQKGFAVEAYVANDVYRRLFLDLGAKVVDSAPSPTAALSRLKEIRDYIRETVASSFRKLKVKDETLSGSRVARVVREAIRETFFVFEGYAL